MLVTSLLIYYFAPKQSIVMGVSVSVCLYVCVGTRSYVQNCTSDLHQIFCLYMLPMAMTVFLWSHSDMLCTSSFMDDIIFAHQPRLLDVAAQLKRSAHADLGLAISCAQ